jgi:hypothetical protein
MSAELNPVANHHLPIFITPPGQTDVLMVVTAAFLLIAVVAFGLLFFRLHSLPERMAHRGHKLQFEIVAVLCLISLLTHIHAFWIAALLLALIELPDVSGWMGRIAGGVERIAGKKSAEASRERPSEGPLPDESYAEAPPSQPTGEALSGETPPRSVKDKELTHA